MIETIPIDKIHPATDNLRHDVGDVTGLADSMKRLGLLTALNVTPAKKGGGYLLVAGHRRLAAAKLAGLVELECVVSERGDQDRLGAMFVENFHREDLTPLEEAYGLQRLVDEHKLSQRSIAELIGCNQSHVSRRLSLLAIPAPILKTLDDGALTIRDAEELTKLAATPARMHDAVKKAKESRHLSMAQCVGRVQEEIAWDAKRETATAKLDAGNIKVVAYPDHGSWYNSKFKPLNDRYYGIEITKAKHSKEPCHAAAVSREGDIVYVCTDPSRHQTTAARRQPTKSERETNTRRRLIDAAKKRRHAFLATLLEKRIPKDPITELLGRQLVYEAGADVAKLACKLAGLEPKEYSTVLGALAGSGADGLSKAALAVAFAEAEQAMHWQATGGYNSKPSWTDCREAIAHFDYLRACGYEPDPVELALLNGEQLKLEAVA